MTDINHPCEIISDLYSLSKIRTDFTKTNIFSAVYPVILAVHGKKHLLLLALNCRNVAQRDTNGKNG